MSKKNVIINYINNNTGSQRFNSVTRRNYLRAAGAASIGGLSFPAVLSQTGSAATLSHTLTITGDGSDTAYSFTVSGDLEAHTGLTGEDEISRSTATGAIAGGQDSYAFSGEITTFSYEGGASFYLDGKETLPAELLPRTLTIEGVDTRTEYAFETSKGVGPVGGLTTEDGIVTEHNSARGAVGDGRDSYRFAGEITEFSMSSDAQLVIDGKYVDVTELLPRTLTVTGGGSHVEYIFEVSGGIAGRYGHTGEDAIGIDNGQVTGAVGGGRDSYAFSGDVAEFYLDGDADVFVDDSRVAPESLGDSSHTLTVSGTGSTAMYSFTVDGSISVASGLTGEDTINGLGASGAVGGGDDSYRFSGDVTTFHLHGDANVSIDGVDVDPDTLGGDSTLTIDGSGPVSRYSFMVDGSLSGAEGLTGEDEISGSSVSGAVGGGSDSYRFDGDMMAFDLDGDANVYLNGEQILWRTAASMPAAQGDLGGAVLGDRLYVFGGFRTGTGLDAVNRAFVYDPARGADGAWSRIENLPRALWAPCGVAGRRKLFSFGGAPPNSPYGTGDPPTDAIFSYTPGDGWTDLTATRDVRCPYRNWAMGGVYNPNDGLIYCVGGATVDNEDESRIWTFDPDRERVVDPNLARLPEAKRWHTVALVEADDEHCIHAIGGRRGPSGPTDSNLRFGIDSGRAKRMQRMPQPGSYTTATNPVIGNSVYLTHARFLSGSLSTDDYTTVCHRYDPRRDRFDTDLPQARYRRGGTAGGVIDGTLFVAGGQIKRYEQNGLHDCVAHVEAFRPFE